MAGTAPQFGIGAVRINSDIQTGAKYGMVTLDSFLVEKYLAGMIAREEVVILGVSCEGGGVIDTRKVADALRGKEARSAAYDGAGNIKVSTMSGEATLPAA